MVHFLWLGAVVGLLCVAVERFLLRRATPDVGYAFGLASLALLAMIAGACVWLVWPAAGAGTRARGLTPPGAVTVPSEGFKVFRALSVSRKWS